MDGHLRLIYEKRDGACFVPHVALATVFTRAAARAGIKLHMTAGFSPRPKMSFGPELPAGVVALREPVDVWLNMGPGDFCTVWDAYMPEGFCIRRCLPVAEGVPVLGKLCQAAQYIVWARRDPPAESLLRHLESHYGEDILNAVIDNTETENGAETKSQKISFVLAAPARNGIGGWVKSLVASDAVRGWQDLCIVRADIGRWNGFKIESLSESFSGRDGACLQNAESQTEK